MRSNKQLHLKIFLLAVSLLWILFLSIHFFSNHFPALAPVMIYGKLLTGNICHQSPQKLLKIGTAEALVCSRCFGIYTGALISAFLLLVIKYFNDKILLKFLYFSITLLLVDVFASTISIYDYTKTIAFSTGLFFGLIAGIFIFTQLLKGAYE